MLKHFIYFIYNQLLYGTDENGILQFKNFNFLSDSAFSYNLKLSQPQLAQIANYRIQLSKKYKIFIIFVSFFWYYVFLKNDLSLINVLFCFGSLLLTIYILALYFTRKYAIYLRTQLGEYTVMRFHPTVNEEKQVDFFLDLLKRVLSAVVILGIYIGGIFAFNYTIKKTIINKKFEEGLKICKIYDFVYPKTKLYYNMRAIILYTQKNYKQALIDYIKTFRKTGKKFTENDIARFSNLLILERKVTNAQNAIIVFEKELSKKKLSINYKTQMLWIKSMFSLNSGLKDDIIADYDKLLSTIKNNDKLNRFYILSDKAYMLYLLGNYTKAVETYNAVIDWAENYNVKFEKDLARLYAERGFAKLKLKDSFDADRDFIYSKFSESELPSLEPTMTDGKFVIEKF